jgi:exoribonuclease R
LAAPYAHVTAPLRRLADRYASQAAVELAAGRPVAGWVIEALERLPAAMARATQRAAAIDRRVLDLVEAVVLAPRVGETFHAVAVHHRGDTTEVTVPDPAVVATVDGALELGATIRVRLADADPVAGTVTFVPA